MIANIKILEKYCKNYTKIENYAEAVKSPLRYDLHHRREISENKSKSDLIAENLYYYRPATELIFLEHGEHVRLHNAGKQYALGHHCSEETRQKMSEAHKNMSEETRHKMSAAMKGDKNPMFGKPKSAETKQKLSAALKGDKNPMFGKHCSAETKQKISDAHKGRHWHLENGHRIWTE